MTIKPIKTERDYQKALKEIEKLWDAKPNTAKGDRLEVLVTLVEAYEQKHYRIEPPDPCSRPCLYARVYGSAEKKRISSACHKKHLGMG
jgi:HTH-type transcriptional regulator/antitoxin HigA